MTDNPSEEGFTFVCRAVEILNSVLFPYSRLLQGWWTWLGGSDLCERPFARTTEWELYHTAELNRLCGGASLARQKPSETHGGKSLRVAIEIARAHQAKLLEVRATTPLGRLLLGQSRRPRRLRCSPTPTIGCPRGSIPPTRRTRGAAERTEHI